VAGFALGAATALDRAGSGHGLHRGDRDRDRQALHEQLEELGEEDPELAELITKARDDEREHRDAAFEMGAERAPAYPLLSGAIRLGCRFAIKLSERI
jgi:ubiquinone biosynthesis monooxygenase Coq7